MEGFLPNHFDAGGNEGSRRNCPLLPGDLLLRKMPAAKRTAIGWGKGVKGFYGRFESGIGFAV